MGITKNVVTDYSPGLDNTGATDIVARFFSTIRPDLVGQDFANLTFPAGTYLMSTSNSAVMIPQMGDLTINGAGATIQDAGGGQSLFAQSNHECQIGIDASIRNVSTDWPQAVGGQSARILTCNPGDTSVTLTAASAAAGHISRFVVGQWLMVSGWTIQAIFLGQYGYPNNFHFHDYVKITSIVGNTIYFTGHPLTNYYSQDWPEYARGSEFEIDQGGPASIFGMAFSWDGTTTLNDLTYNVSRVGSDFTNCCRRVFIANNSRQTGKTYYPSMMHTFRAINSSCDPGTLLEHDKNITRVDVQGGSYNIWRTQSSSTTRATWSGVTFTSLDTGRYAELDNCTITGQCRIGPQSYGAGEYSRFSNCSFGQDIVGGIGLAKIEDKVISMVGGLMTIPLPVSDSYVPYMVPDAAGRNVYFWGGSSGAFAPFKVLSVTADRWPAADIQSATTSITMANGSKTLTTSSGVFTPGDVGKTIRLPKTGVQYWSNDSGITVTISNASPGVVTWNSHGKVLNEAFQFRSGVGTLPSGASAGVTYYVVAANLTTNTFSFATAPGGAAINTSGGSGNIAVSGATEVYSFITGYTNSSTVTVYHACAYFDVNSVSVQLQWGTCNAYVQTDQLSGLPNSSLYASAGRLDVRIPGARKVLFENCFGTPQAEDLSQPGAQNRPFASYTKRLYNGQTGFSGQNGPNVALTGKILSIKVNVITPYTGAGSLTTSGWNLMRMIGDTQTGAYSYYPGVFDLKTPGERVINPGGTDTGLKPLDANTGLTSDAWVCGSQNGGAGGFQVALSRSITGESAATRPEFTVEIITDQGFSTDATTFVRLGGTLGMRLRA